MEARLCGGADRLTDGAGIAGSCGRLTEETRCQVKGWLAATRQGTVQALVWAVLNALHMFLSGWWVQPRRAGCCFEFLFVLEAAVVFSSQMNSCGRLCITVVVLNSCC